MKKRDALYYALLVQGGRSRSEIHSDMVKTIVTVTLIERPARKLILLRSKTAVDYMSYCEEMGCDWENDMNEIACRFDDAAIVSLPESMVTPQMSRVASGIEIPLDHTVDLPRRYEVVDLPPCEFLYFKGATYDDENDFCEMIGIVSEALNSYDPEAHGWKFDFESSPSFNYGASSKKGARMAVPIVKLQ